MSIDVTDLPAPPRPRSKAPNLLAPLVGGGSWALAGQSPENFTMVIFYRGLHCPACRAQLQEVQEHLDELHELGVQPVAISADGRSRAERARDDWDITRLPLGYDLDLPTMRAWGLFVSESSTAEEPALFSEPALFLVKSDQEVYYAALATMPFGRPKIAELVGGVRYVLSIDYPARGNS